MAGSKSDIEKRLAELKKEVPRRGFDRYASLLKNVTELPGELQSPAVTALASHENIQTIVMFPQQIQRGWEYVPKQALLFTATGVIHLLASIWHNQEPQITRVDGCELHYLKLKLVLLYGFLEVVAQGEDTPVRLNMEFNTVSWNYLSAPLQQLLQMTKTAPSLLKDTGIPSITTQQTLENLPLKFSNGLELYGLLPGEKLEEVVFQAGTWARWLYLFRKPVSANTMLLLTSHYMVVITEELYVKQGWIISYIPRCGIVRVQSQPRGLWSELSVQLERGGQSVEYQLTLKREAVESWCRQWMQHGGQWVSLPEVQQF